MSITPARPLPGTLRLVFIALFGPLSFLFGAIALTNSVDLLESVGVDLGSWSSNNVEYVESVLASVGWGPGPAPWIVLGATAMEAVAAIGYGIAAALLILGRPGVRGPVRVATAGAFFTWIGLAFGAEAFIVYEMVDWTKYLVAAGLSAAGWIAAELFLAERATDG
jgi:hypothetical protein